jgi:hypothetical protein
MTALEQVLSRSVGEPNTGCMLWLGALTGRGYGAARVGEKVVEVHRLVASLQAGRALQRGEVVMHRCDVPTCVNPDHLVVGTHSQNLRDAYARGRR